jgi:hypothetical protein
MPLIHIIISISILIFIENASLPHVEGLRYFYTLQETSKRSSVITDEHAFIINEDKLSSSVNQ